MAAVKPKPVLVRDWNRRYAGKLVRVRDDRSPIGARPAGTLCGYVADGHRIGRVLVAFRPMDRQWYELSEVILL